MELRNAGLINAEPGSDFPHRQLLLVVKLDHLTLPFRDALQRVLQDVLSLTTVTCVKLMTIVVRRQLFRAGDS